MRFRDFVDFENIYRDYHSKFNEEGRTSHEKERALRIVYGSVA